MREERSLATARAELAAAVAARDVEIFDGAPNPHAAGVSLESIRGGLAESAARVELAELLGGDARADRQAWIARAAAAGLLQREIAELARVSRQWVRQVTNGTRP